MLLWCFGGGTILRSKGKISRSCWVWLHVCLCGFFVWFFFVCMPQTTSLCAILFGSSFGLFYWIYSSNLFFIFSTCGSVCFCIFVLIKLVNIFFLFILSILCRRQRIFSFRAKERTVVGCVCVEIIAEPNRIKVLTEESAGISWTKNKRDSNENIYYFCCCCCFFFFWLGNCVVGAVEVFNFLLLPEYMTNSMFVIFVIHWVRVSLLLFSLEYSLYDEYIDRS